MKYQTKPLLAQSKKGYNPKYAGLPEELLFCNHTDAVRVLNNQFKVQ